MAYSFEGISPMPFELYFKALDRIVGFFAQVGVRKVRSPQTSLSTEYSDPIYVKRSCRSNLCISKQSKKCFHHDSALASVTRWLDYFSIFGHSQQCKLAQKRHIFAKVGSAFCQSVEISPNLVTLA